MRYQQVQYTKMNLLSKYVADLFRVAVDSVEEKREAKTKNSSGKECREYGDLLPPYLNPRIYKEADCQHDECNKAWTQQSYYYY